MSAGYELSPEISSAMDKWQNYIHNWDTMPDEQRFTKDEARAIWRTVHEAMANATYEQRVAFDLLDYLAVERMVKGFAKRCSVCGAWSDKDCWENC